MPDQRSSFQQHGYISNSLINTIRGNGSHYLRPHGHALVCRSQKRCVFLNFKDEIGLDKGYWGTKEAKRKAGDLQIEWTRDESSVCKARETHDAAATAIVDRLLNRRRIHSNAVINCTIVVYITHFA